MTNERRGAAVVGALFIAATGFFMAGQMLHGPFLSSAEALELAQPNRTRVVAGILLELLGVLAIPLIALVFYPILRRVSELAALSYVGLRIIEAAALVIVDANLWAMVSLSEAYHAGTASAGTLATQLGTLHVVNESTFLISVAIAFPLGSCLLNAVLWRTRLVPRVISGWGILGATLLLLGSLFNSLALLPDLSPVLLELLLTVPIAVQEMALAVWLIAKGVAGPDSRVGSV
ncbi:MAG TPA: DUF4386 domain-containing protein [Gemmatimonadota bacterium]|nr:DUF4386 domain-containing protein [Gemmatimonadota bacterium]